ncbi:hypothetical protein M011DRAFT_468943 [Sporormia fimetaria CBS 119925]|uniref:CCHC-type domain-containing protein n=1 Tax=Sporormia fimetaria CBS 119925 TaxID=1340428 RepID=A0A6A6V5Y5_9PLEO|nr:hypothetical protein M011DRAFT_468943 [Sporormia fimetaria CBS 119925]
MATNTPKTMSSRLMTMKFMQRSAAKSASATEPTTPNGPPSAKRVRLSNGRSAPGTPHTPSDQEILRTALEEEERKREEALAKAFEASGETKWVLSVYPDKTEQTQGLKVVYKGFGNIDLDDSSESGEEEEESRPMRMQFGGGVQRKEQKVPVATAEDSDVSEDGEVSEDSEDDSDDPAAELIREVKRETRQETKREKQTTRRPKLLDEDDDLHGLKSLSGGGGGGGGGGRANIQCFSCGEKGHMKSECPKSQRRKSGGRPANGRRSGGLSRF